ncbi:MAG: hypothetical protein IJF25_02880 [Oscillospiraceae bacterium]|nr:hypothetical protein [Oscillospiraceae bacterium]MBQ4539378.1 hypothetical protein [Oscillospiraceae bacterium]
MSSSNILGLLGLCRKAGRIKLGFDPVEKVLGAGACLILFSSDVSPKTKQRMLKKAEVFNVDHITLSETSDDIWYAIGKRTAVMAITDQGFAKRAAELHQAASSRPTENHNEEDTDL